MSGTGKNCGKGGVMLPSESPPLPLYLDPIILGNNKSSRTGELKKVLRVPLGSTSEGRPSGGDQIRSAATEELKNFKESVQDSSKKACYRVKMFRQSISKLDKFAETLGSKKRLRNDLLSSEKPGIDLEKMGNQPHGNTRDSWNQRMEQKPKNAGLVKRFRTSVADGQADIRSTLPRQPTIKHKREEKLPAVPIRMEENTCRVPAGGDGWEKKIKRKRSVSAVGGRFMHDDIDPKQAADFKAFAGSKLGSSDGPGFRSKSSSGVDGVNKQNHRFESPSPNAPMAVRNDQDAASSPRDSADMLGQRVLLKGTRSNSNGSELSTNCRGSLGRRKVSRVLGTGSLTVLDSSTNSEALHCASQDWEQPPNDINFTALDVATEKIHDISQPMAKWGSQRPHKKSRVRRANLLSPVTNHSEIQNSPEEFAMTELSCQGPMITNDASLHAGGSNVNTLKVKKELQEVASPATLSESEESGALDNGQKKMAVDGCGIVLTLPNNARDSVLPAKNKIPNRQTGDGVRRQGRSGRGLSMRPVGSPMGEKLDDLRPKPPPSVRPGSERKKSKSGRPGMKKLKDRKCFPRVGSVHLSGSPEFMGDMDDHETLVAAANSTRNALNQACSSRFWKKMECIFSSLSNGDTYYLKEQLGLAEELDESLSLIFGINSNTSDARKDKDYTDRRHGINLGRESSKVGLLSDKFDIGRFYKFPSMFERLVSALIDEESEEAYHQAEGKNLSSHASDDSHCGSCNQMDIDSKDRDRMESEVESAVEQNQKLCLLDRLSCNKGSASSTFRNSSMFTSGYSNEYSFGDEYSQLEMGLASEICSSDIGKLQQKELHVSGGFPCSDEQYQLMSLNDRLILELRSIDLYPETLPDLAEEEELICGDLADLNGKLYQKVRKTRKRLEELDKAVISGQDTDRRKIEEMAMNKIVEMAYKRRMACRGTNTTKASVRRVPNQVALAFTKRTLARYKDYEETGISCFRDPTLQDVLFSRPAGKSDKKSVGCVGSGTASNILNGPFKPQAETKASGAISNNLEMFNSRGGSTASLSFVQDSDKPGSSKVTSAFEMKSTAVSECKTQTKTKQRLIRKSSSHSIAFSESPETAFPPDSSNPTQATDVPPDSSKEVEGREAIDPLKLTLDGNPEQDLGSLLDFDDDMLQDCFTAGLEEPPWDDFPSVMMM